MLTANQSKAAQVGPGGVCAAPDRAKIVAAQWQIRAIAKGKPPHIRDAAWTAIWNLTRIGRGRGGPGSPAGGRREN